MSFRLTIVLLVVLVALGAVVFYVNQNPATPTPSDAVSDSVMTFLSSDVTQLEATSKAQSVLVVKNASGGWALQKPEAGPADEPRVESTIAGLAALVATRTLAAPGDLGQFGLADPAVTVKVTLRADVTKTLLLGGQTPDKSGYYAKLPDAAAVYLIDASDGDDLSQLVTDPPKATPTPTPEPVTGTPGPGTPTAVPAAGAAEGTPAPAASDTPEPALPAQAVTGTPTIPDVPVPPEALTPTPAT